MAVVGKMITVYYTYLSGIILTLYIKLMKITKVILILQVTYLDK